METRQELENKGASSVGRQPVSVSSPAARNAFIPDKPLGSRCLLEVDAVAIEAYLRHLH